MNGRSNARDRVFEKNQFSPDRDSHCEFVIRPGLYVMLRILGLRQFPSSSVMLCDRGFHDPLGVARFVDEFEM